MNAAGEDLKYAADAIWKVLIASVILGAGLPILYGAGLRSLAWGRAAGQDVTGATERSRPNPAGTVLAVILFALVVYGIAAGIVYVIATGKGSGYDIGFDNLIPVIKKTS